MKITHSTTTVKHAINRNGTEVPVEIDLVWEYYGGEPGSLSICEGVTLKSITAYDSLNAVVPLSLEEEESIIQLYGLDREY